VNEWLAYNGAFAVKFRQIFCLVSVSRSSFLDSLLSGRVSSGPRCNDLDRYCIENFIWIHSDAIFDCSTVQSSISSTRSVCCMIPSSPNAQKKAVPS
jgi:hypothetical protein